MHQPLHSLAVEVGEKTYKWTNINVARNKLYSGYLLKEYIFTTLLKSEMILIPCLCCKTGIRLRVIFWGKLFFLCSAGKKW